MQLYAPCRKKVVSLQKDLILAEGRKPEDADYLTVLFGSWWSDCMQMVSRRADCICTELQRDDTVHMVLKRKD